MSVENFNEGSVTQNLFLHRVKVNELFSYCKTLPGQILGFALYVELVEVLLPFLDQACVYTHEE